MILLNKNIACFAVIAWLFLSFNSGSAQTISDTIIVEINRRVEAQINPSVAIAVLQPDGTVQYYNFGMTDIDGEQEVDEHTVFEIGSITKTFTAAILQHHQNEIDLQSSLLEYFPSVENDKLAAVKVADLLNHTSGFPRLSEEFSPADWANPFADYSSEKLTSELQKLTPDTAKNWSYSNLGYATLGRIIENASNKSSSTLFAELFADSKLKASYLNRHEVPDNQLAKPTYLGINFSHWDFAAESAYAGTIKSSTADLIQYIKYQINKNHLFNPDKAIKMPHNTNIDFFGEDKLFYKNGWFIIKPDAQTEVLTHNGGTGGFSSFIAYNKNTKMGIVMLTNSLSIIDDIGLKIIYPEFELKHTSRTIAYELAEMVKNNDANELYDLYVSNKSSEKYKMDIIQVYWLERLCFSQEKYEFSNELASIIIDVLPDDWEALDIKGDNLAKLNQFEAAINHYQKAKSLNPKNIVLDEKIDRCQKLLN